MRRKRGPQADTDQPEDTGQQGQEQPDLTDGEVLDLLLDRQAQTHELVVSLVRELREVNDKLDDVLTQLSETTTD